MTLDIFALNYFLLFIILCFLLVYGFHWYILWRDDSEKDFLELMDGKTTHNFLSKFYKI